jgi:hypothetical protein
MNLSAEQIQSNWEEFIGYIDTYISEPRKSQLIGFYKKHQEEIMLMPASHKKAYHNAFPGGYVDHVNRVVKGALSINKVWLDFECEENYTEEELVFSALNHDLGKLGDEDNYSHLPSQDEWRKKNLGEMYKFNDKLSYMSVPDRGLRLLVNNGIKISENEWLAIKLHDGLYDPSNERYLKTYMPELKPRTSLVYIVHQADLMASRVEFEKEWLPKFGVSNNDKKNFKVNKNSTTSTKTKALGTIKSQSLKNMLDNL